MYVPLIPLSVTSDSELKASFDRAVQAYERDEMKRAIEMFRELADHGEAQACVYLGLIYSTGDGVQTSISTSEFWFRRQRVLLDKQSKQGDLNASLALGKIYQYGNHTNIDETKAISLIRAAAQGGHAEAQFHLATQYQYGWCGLEENHEEYEKWLDRAVVSKHPEAMFVKGNQILDQSRAAGMALIREAADAGFFLAQEFLESS